VRSLIPCKDTLKYASLRAEPEFRYALLYPYKAFCTSCACVIDFWLFPFSVLGKRLGKSMGVVAKEVKAMSQIDILEFEKAGEVTIASHCLKLSDIKVLLFLLC
jgi:isoleucyl-tRNA synthetase